MSESEIISPFNMRRLGKENRFKIDHTNKVGPHRSGCRNNKRLECADDKCKKSIPSTVDVAVCIEKRRDKPE